MTALPFPLPVEAAERGLAGVGGPSTDETDDARPFLRTPAASVPAAGGWSGRLFFGLLPPSVALSSAADAAPVSLAFFLPFAAFDFDADDETLTSTAGGGRPSRTWVIRGGSSLFFSSRRLIDFLILGLDGTHSRLVSTTGPSPALEDEVTDDGEVWLVLVHVDAEDDARADTAEFWRDRDGPAREGVEAMLLMAGAREALGWERCARCEAGWIGRCLLIGWAGELDVERGR